jgi:hypothetical protein
MKKVGIILFFILTIFYFPILKADILSINAGGGTDIVINPDTYIEGFFSCVNNCSYECSPLTCAILGYNCDNWNDGCGGTLSCGICASGFTCTSGICTGTTPGGAPGGGEVTPVSKITITPLSINLTLSFNNQTRMSQRITQKIYVTNNGTSSQTLSISYFGLDNIILLSNTSLIVASGETKELSVDFIAPLEERDFKGYIQIGTKHIPVFIHVTSNPLWFDSNIAVLNRNYQVSQGNLLKTRVELIPMGEKSRLDVTLNYQIKDTSGKVYLTQSETVLVENKMNFDRNFGTGMLPLGNYIVYLDLIYPGGDAPSSAHFEVVEKSVSDIFGIVLFFLVLGILMIAIFIILLLIRRRKRNEQ